MLRDEDILYAQKVQLKNDEPLGYIRQHRLRYLNYRAEINYCNAHCDSRIAAASLHVRVQGESSPLRAPVRIPRAMWE